MTLQNKKIIKAITVINMLPSSPPSLRVGRNRPQGDRIGCLPLPILHPTTTTTCPLQKHQPRQLQLPARLGGLKEGPQWNPRRLPARLEKPEPGLWETTERVSPGPGAHQAQSPQDLALSLCNSSVPGPPGPQAGLTQALFSLAPQSPITAQPNAPPLPS